MDQINAVKVNIRDSFQKHYEILSSPNIWLRRVWCVYIFHTLEENVIAFESAVSYLLKRP